MKRTFLCLSLLLILSIVGCGEPDPMTSQDPDPVPSPVPAPPPEKNDPPVEENDGLQIGSRVKVTNTGNDGLRIRNPPGVEQIEDNIIGNAGEGSTGIILEGPGLGDGYAWWRIKWDKNDKVKFKKGEPCCIGWSAETNRAGDIRYLTKIQ